LLSSMPDERAGSKMLLLIKVVGQGNLQCVLYSRERGFSSVRLLS